MVELIETLCRANGVSGDEREVRELIKLEFEDTECDIETDSMGNLFVTKKGESSGKTLLITANTDEIGFIVSGFTDSGYLKFKPVGNVSAGNIISKRVVVNTNTGKLKGVIGMKAIHLQKREEREKESDIKDLFIDIGAVSKDEAEMRVALGDYVSFDTEPCVMGRKIAAKALSSRVPCAVLIEFIKNVKNNKYDICACFTSQKEVGARGAVIAAHRVKPYAAVIIDAVDSADSYGIDEEKRAAYLGKGVIIKNADSRAIFNRELSERLYNGAKEQVISVQRINAMNDINDFSDAKGIQTAAGGVDSVSVAIPVRYKNTPVSMADPDDARSAVKLLELFVNDMQ